MSLSELHLDGTNMHGMKSSLGFILELMNGARLSNEVSVPPENEWPNGRWKEVPIQWPNGRVRSRSG